MKFKFFVFILIFSNSVIAQVDFRNPTRNYIQAKGSWNIYYEASMKSGNPNLTNEVLTKLKNVLINIEKNLPRNSMQKLKSLNIFLLWGEDSPHGGKKSGMRFVRRGETKNRLHYDNKWEHSIIIYSAENLMYLTDMWSNKALVHELAHAWHIMHWPDSYSEISIPWKKAKAKNLYTNVEDYKGRIIPNAYARKNNLEYFAELSAMYFVGGNYYPYNKKQLNSYDPNGASMVEKIMASEIVAHNISLNIISR